MNGRLPAIELVCVEALASTGLTVHGVDERGRALVLLPVVGDLAPLEDVVRARLEQETRENQHHAAGSLSETLRTYLVGCGYERAGAFLIEADGRPLRLIDALAARRQVEHRSARAA
jgi:hypothetical protein